MRKPFSFDLARHLKIVVPILKHCLPAVVISERFKVPMKEKIICLFERLFKVKKNGVFLCGNSVFI